MPGANATRAGRGFCSSFNFIPEGEYKVPSELRDELVMNGFEVGIHDLKHDGRLFLSRRDFSHKALRELIVTTRLECGWI
jgi:hypothetical protein